MAEEEKSEETENDQPAAEEERAGSDPSPEGTPEPEDAQGSDPSESSGEETPESAAEEEGAGSDPSPEEAPEAAEEESAGSDPSPEETPEPAEAQGSDPSESSGETPEEPGEPEDTHPKAVRKRRRAQAQGEARPSRSAEERAAERADRRRGAAAGRRRHRQTQRQKRGEPGTGTPPADRELAARKVRLGTVVSSKGDKSITVKVEQVGRHRRYEKVVRHSRTLHAHDEANQANEGDVVRVVETRPLSRTKRWRLVEILERAR